LEIGPQDRQQIYYTTDSALYRTFDGGATWLSSRLPSSRSGQAIVVDYQTPNVIYLGLGRYK